MSLNSSHQNGGIVLYQGERMLQSRDDIELEFDGNSLPKEMKSAVKGRAFLTTHRVIFKTDKPDQNGLKSFSMPFFNLTGVELKQPIFGANAIKGKIEAEPDGGWQGSSEFRLTFNHGGAIEFGQHMLKTASNAQRLPHNPPAPINMAYGYPPPDEFYPPSGWGPYWRFKLGYRHHPFHHGPPYLPPPGDYLDAYGQYPRAQAPGYGAPTPGYGAPTPGYRAPGYGAPTPGYGAPTPGYGAPTPGYGAPTPGYGAPTSYEAPPSYSAQQTSNAASAPDFYQSNGGAFFNPTDPQSVYVTPSCLPPAYEEPKKSK